MSTECRCFSSATCSEAVFTRVALTASWGTLMQVLSTVGAHHLNFQSLQQKVKIPLGSLALLCAETTCIELLARVFRVASACLTQPTCSWCVHTSGYFAVGKHVYEGTGQTGGSRGVRPGPDCASDRLSEKIYRLYAAF